MSSHENHLMTNLVWEAEHVYLHWATCWSFLRLISSNINQCRRCLGRITASSVLKITGFPAGTVTVNHQGRLHHEATVLYVPIAFNQRLYKTQSVNVAVAYEKWNTFCLFLFVFHFK